MTTQHTPGPWRVLRPSSGVDHNWHVTDEMDTFVAHVFGFSHAVDEQSRINACLIAAAPDLLDALEAARRLIELISPLEGDEMRQINRAIAKATGGSA